MAAVNLVVIVEAIRNIATHSGDDLNDFVLTAVIAVGIALGTSFTVPENSVLMYGLRCQVSALLVLLLNPAALKSSASSMGRPSQ